MSDYPAESDSLHAAPPVGPPIPPIAGNASAGSTGDGGNDDVSHRVRRSRQLKLAVFTSILTRPISFLLPLITIPLFYSYLGVERYGLYEAIGALAMYIGMTNFGLSLGLLNSLAECHVNND